MRNGWVGKLQWLLLLGVFFACTGGCGYKNAPIPPQKVVPEPIKDLLYKADDKGVQLSWSYPVKTIKGTPLDDISSFELYQAEIPLEEYCRTCPIPFGEPLELDGGSPFDGNVRRKAGYALTMLRPGYKYFFKVRSRTSWWADSDDSNIVTFVWFQPAAAAEGVMAIPGDRQITLQWQPVTMLTNGREAAAALKYQVLRRSGNKGFRTLGEPVAATEFVDRQVNNGTQYAYAVQSLMVLQDELVNGATSATVTAVPVDLTPRGSPTGVNAVQTAVGVKIFWDKVDAGDIGGYQVYRRAADRDDYELLGKVDAEHALFVDATAGDNMRYYYAVTAIDKATPPNESNMSQEATLRY